MTSTRPTRSTALQFDKSAATAALTPPARRMHLEVLTAFTGSGRPPSRSELAELARSHAIDPVLALAELADRDLIAFDKDGEVRAAYPYSAVPTAHRVSWSSGPAVYAMCAIDALGISAMIGRPVTIRTAEPDSDAAITVQVDRENAIWTPATAVVYFADTGDSCCASADRTCGYINFFTGPESARDWADRHPDLEGTLLGQRQALTYGISEFGALLHASGSIAASGPRRRRRSCLKQ